MNRLFSLVAALFLVHSAAAQLLDDSTKAVYSARTIFWFSEEDLRSLSDSLQVLDTLLVDIENFDATDISNHRLIHLGNNGTATHSLHYQFPSIVGARLGVDAYNPYFKPPNKVRYYDTKSPWIKIRAVLGGQGRSIADVGYSRNISPRWNIGVDYQLLTSDKQIGASANRGDRNVISNLLDVYTSFRTKNERYHLLFNVDWMKHRVKETGGILVSDNATTAELFQYRDSPIRLSGAESIDERLHFHLFQKYKLANLLQLYYSIDKGRHDVRYFDPVLQTNKAAYPQMLIRTDTTDDVLQLRDLTNEAGILGRMNGLSYNLYLKRRDINFSNRFSNPFGKSYENYAGVKINTRLFDIWETYGKVEFMQGGFFDIEGATQLPFLRLWLRSMRYRPGYQPQYHYGNHYQWDNDLAPQHADRLGGELDLKWGGLQLQPGLNLTRVARYVYFAA